MSLVSGAYIVKFIQYLGGGDQWIGVFTAIPSLIGLLQIPGAIWGRSFPFYKRFVAPGGITWRVLYLPLAAIPFLPIPPSAGLYLLLACVSLASVAIQIVSPIYNDWLAEMIPANSRGWFFARRNAMQAWVGSVAALGGGFISDTFGRMGQEQLGFAVIFAIGGLFGIISQIFFNKMKDIPRPNPVKMSLRTGVAGMGLPFRDREFRRTLVFFFFFIFAQAFAGNLFGAYAFESLKMSMTALQVTAICHAVGNLAAIRMWGFFGDKYGNKPILAILTVGIALTPAPWIFCRPGDDVFNATILGLGHILAGVCWGGISVCQFNLLLATSRESDRANYIGAGMALQSLTGALSPLLGAQLMSLLRLNMPPEVAYHWIFGITMALRMGSLIFLVRVKETGSVSIRETLHELSRVSPTGIRAMRQMTHAGDAMAREVAIASAAESRFEIARDEVIKALHDPSPRVRRQAASALASLGGREAVEAILHILNEHPDMVEEEAIDTLGKLGDPSAVDALIGYLRSPRPLLRRASARALSEIGGPTAADALRQAAGVAGDLDLRRAALQGLRLLEHTAAAPEIANALLDAHPSIRVAAAEAVSEMNLKSAAPNLRASLARFTDEAGGEVAYALGTVGDERDVPLILSEARRSTSVMTRRRCLLGVACLYGVEPDVYRLLLLEGMARDTRLMQMLSLSGRQPDVVRESLDRFTLDQEDRALDALRTLGEPFGTLAQHPVDELFLIAAALLAKRPLSTS